MAQFEDGRTKREALASMRMLIRRELGVKVKYDDLEDFIIANWRRLSRDAHRIHRDDEKQKQSDAVGSNYDASIRKMKDASL